MGILSRKMFYTFEILDVIGPAQHQATDNYFRSLSATIVPANHAKLAKLYSELTALKVQANRMFRDDETAASPKVYRSTDAFWRKVDALVSQVPTPAVLEAVAALPNDFSPDAGTPGWVKTATFAGIGAAILGAGWYYIRGNR